MRTCQLCEATSAGTEVRWRNPNSKVCRWCEGELERSGRGFCTQCFATPPLADMRDCYCVACKRARNVAYYARNAERERARVEAYRQAHPDAWRRRQLTSAQRRAYYQRRIEHFRQRGREFHVRHRGEYNDKIRALRVRRVAENPNYWRERNQRQKVRMFRKLFAR